MGKTEGKNTRVRQGSLHIWCHNVCIKGTKSHNKKNIPLYDITLFWLMVNKPLSAQEEFTDLSDDSDFADPVPRRRRGWSMFLCMILQEVRLVN